MRYLSSAILVLVIAGSLFGADAAEEARQAEIAFAKAFADRDADRFFGMVAEDAHFLSPSKTFSGKASVREGWSGLFKDEKAPFSWKPERVLANAAGTLALSAGPVYDPAGNHVGNYTSTWQKEADGSWKVIFDGPGAPVCPPAEKK